MTLRRADLNTVETLSRFFHFLSGAHTAVLEHPIGWPRAVRQYDLLLSILQPRVDFETVMDFRSTPFVGEAPPPSRLQRKVVRLRDFERPPLESIREAVAKGLFGGSLAGSGRWRPTPLSQDVVPAALTPAYDLAKVAIEGDVARVESAAQPWAYAATLPLRWPCPRPNLVQIRVQIEMEQGEWHVGVIVDGGSDIHGPRRIGASPHLQRIDILVPPDLNVDALLIRSGGSGSPGIGFVHGIEVLERDDSLIKEEHTA